MVIVKFKGLPAQPFAVGVTVIVAILEELNVFCPVKTGIEPFPESINPVDGLELVQLKVVPAVVEPGLTRFEFAPAHID